MDIATHNIILLNVMPLSYMEQNIAQIVKVFNKLSDLVNS